LSTAGVKTLHIVRLVRLKQYENIYLDFEYNMKMSFELFLLFTVRKNKKLLPVSIVFSVLVVSSVITILPKVAGTTGIIKCVICRGAGGRRILDLD